MEVDQPACNGGDDASIGESGGSHGRGITPDAVLLGIQEQSGGPCGKNCLGRDVARDESLSVVKLDISEA